MIEQLASELLESLETVLLLHNDGCEELRKIRGMEFEKITKEDILEIVVTLADDMSNYNTFHRVHPTKLDLTKILTFSAKALRLRNSNYTATPLFWRYLKFLDEDVYGGLGFTLAEFGEYIFYAENLQSMLAVDQWLSPFCFFRAINLSLGKCAVPRIENLLANAS